MENKRVLRVMDRMTGRTIHKETVSVKDLEERKIELSQRFLIPGFDIREEFSR